MPMPHRNDKDNHKAHRRAIILMLCGLALLICLDASGK